MSYSVNTARGWEEVTSQTGENPSRVEAEAHDGEAEGTVEEAIGEWMLVKLITGCVLQDVIEYIHISFHKFTFEVLK